MINPANRKRVLRRLKALLSMTVERGASEAEALVAAGQAAKLMTELGQTYRSLEEIEAEAFLTASRPWFRSRAGYKRAGRKPCTRWCLPGISKLCGVDHLWDNETGLLSFFGTEAEVEAAHAFVVIVANALETESAKYRRQVTCRRTQRVNSFRKSMALRINERLLALACAENNEKTTGYALIAIRHMTRHRAFVAEYYAPTKNKPVTISREDLAAAQAGYRAGSNVNLERAQASAKAENQLKDESK